MLFGETVAVYFFERERKREKVGGNERHCNSEGGVGNNIFGLKVPRQCPLVLLIGVRLEFRLFIVKTLRNTQFQFVPHRKHIASPLQSPTG
jgi:hypothetical protein